MFSPVPICISSETKIRMNCTLLFIYFFIYLQILSKVLIENNRSYYLFYVATTGWIGIRIMYLSEATCLV
jgi:hypothetical protein